ncbi:hypothetical protein BDV97DRAFT_346416 [Delphinella strobiligena]|nr:hypothetical protein BDV97DRAFT_346416 [Delphinella strobiligena]
MPFICAASIPLGSSNPSAEFRRTIAIEEEDLHTPVSDVHSGRCCCCTLHICHTSNLERNSSIPALSPVRYLGAILK